MTHNKPSPIPPVLLIAFNRPDTTQKVFDEIRKAKPARFFMAVDGPRDNRPGEDAVCQATRDIVKQVDWDCEVKTLFHEKNLGCAIGVESAITWFFSHVEEGIILEDDCIADQSFFPFCQEMLAKYRNEEKVMLISGDNFQFGRKRGDASYYFSIYSHIWGWATWKRAWKHFDLGIKTFPQFVAEKKIDGILKNKDARKYWLDIFRRFYDGRRKDTWDYQWLYTVWLRNGLAIIPNVNLVSNIGFGADATHTTSLSHKLANLKIGNMRFPLTHPKTLAKHEKADDFTFRTCFYKKTLRSRIKKILGRILAKP